MQDKRRRRKNPPQENRNAVGATVPPPHYIPPTDIDIKEALEKVGFKGAVSLDFVRDICNADACVSNGDDITSIFNYVFPTSDEEKQIAKRVDSIHQFLKSIDFKKVGDGTPLDKAVRIVTALKSVGGKTADEGGIPFIENPKKKSEDAQRLISDVRDFSDFEKIALELEQQTDEQIISKLSGEQNVALAKLSSVLKKTAKFKASSSRRYIPDPNGNVKRPTLMREFSQITSLKPLSQAVMPMFDYKLATKQLVVSQKVKVINQKQLLYLLIDESGSMNNPDRIGYVLAVVLNRLEAVKNGEAVLYISLFDDVIKEPTKIETEAEALDFYKKFRRFKPKGDGTKIDQAIRYAVEHINNSIDGLTQPQIAIVTDGEDSVTIKKGEMQGITLNYVAIKSENADLKELCHQTGGAFISCM